MSAYLEARGRQVEVLFGFLHEAHLALAPPTLFLEGTTLEADADGVVRCRLAGRPSALVRVSRSYFLDIAAFARAWPAVHGELVDRVGEELASAMMVPAPILRPLDDLTAVILEHGVRAEHLYLLGEQAHDVDGSGTFRFAFDEGMLEVAYPVDDGTTAREVEVRWKGAAVALPAQDDVPWRDDDAAELAVLGSMRIGEAPEAVVALYDAVCDETFDALEPTLAVATVLNLRGVAQRKTGALKAAEKTLREALAMARGLDPKLEQMVAYNLGYALLETTMKDRVRLSNGGEHEAAIAHYEVHERHRPRWNECRELFERAALLDPSDVTAQSQVRHVAALLASLDAAGTRGEAPRPAKAGPAPQTDAAPSSLTKELWIPLGVVVFVLGLVFVLYARSKDGPRIEPPPAKAPALAPSVSSDARDAPRRAALARLEREGLPAPGAAPCPLSVEPPRDAPSDEVLAPHFGRAPGTGELYGTDYFDATVRHYASRFAPELDVRPGPHLGAAPLTGAEGPPSWRPNPRPFATTLIVTEWRDPVVVSGGAGVAPGHVAAHLVAWSYADGRFVCASAVEATNAARLVVVRSADLSLPADDPLGRARLDLVEQAYRAAIPRLRTIEMHDAGAADAAAGTRARDGGAKTR